MSVIDIKAAQSWPTNGALIASVAALGYLKQTDKILDPTYGKGLWWSNFKPRRLVKHDIELDGVDFRHLPHRAGTFDAVAYDPPYVSMGGRDTSTLPDFMIRYGLYDAMKSPQALREYNAAGAAEAFRVLKPGGILLWKGMDYVSSGRLQPATVWMSDDAWDIGFDYYIDRFVHIGNGGAQPGGRTKKCPQCNGKGVRTNPLSIDVPKNVRATGLISVLCAECNGSGRVPTTQQHARANFSVLYVFRKPKKGAR